LAPEIRDNEDAFLATIYGRFTEEPQWDGLFQSPLTGTVVTAPFGDMRSYNQGPIEIYHTGVDFAGVIGTPIHAAAAGTIIYSDTLELRGLTVIVDHGLGVMSGYYHLSEILVDVVDRVTAGQIIALGGDTGLSSGPHLHWDLRVNNVPVNGLRWTETAILPPIDAAARPAPP
jgi:murein DD-endopeptidase MepM/ murein hydrolase activator NlpD